MAISPRTSVLQSLRRALFPRDCTSLRDGQLLDCFLQQREEAAFETLVRRHGPMVLGVCRRVLKNSHDAEDAFQATFLVLLRKASSIVPRDRVANWLYGTAYRTALAARTAAARRRAKERETAKLEAVEERNPGELFPLLDAELNRLPDKYRAPIVLCELQGVSRAQAARQLGWPEGTLSCRLARAKLLLAKRLARHGLLGAAGALGMALPAKAALVSVPAPLLFSTVKATSFVAAGQSAAAGAISTQAVALSEGVLKVMFLSRLKVAAMVLLAAGALVGAAVSAFILPARADTLAEKAAEPPKAVAPKTPASPKRMDPRRYLESVEWGLNKVDVEQSTIGIGLLRVYPGDRLLNEGDTDLDLYGRSVGLTVLEDCPVAKDAKVLIDGKEGKLKDLKPRMRLSFRLAADKPEITRIEAATPADAVLKAIDAQTNSITVSLGNKDVTIPLADNVHFSLIDKREAQFGDLKPGMTVDLRLKLDGDKIVVQSILGYK